MKPTLFVLLCTVILSAPAKGQIIRTYAGSGSSGYGGDGGPATNAALDSPSSVAIDRIGNLYFTDQLNFCIRKVDTFGTISTFAGTGHYGSSGDGGPATAARMSEAWGVAVDVAGNVYLTDQQYCRVRFVNSAGTIQNFAGTGTPGTGGDGGPAAAAQFLRPMGIAIDNAGNIYIGDQDAFDIRKISASGIVSTYAGVPMGPGFGGDGGPATAARFHAIYGLATDAGNNLYICDAENNRVRKVSSTGIITTVAGNGVPGFAGDNGPAVNCELNHPTGVWVDKAGELLIGDSYNNRIRRIDRNGIIHTVAGQGLYGFSGNGGASSFAGLAYPSTVVTGANEDIYFVDFRNNRVRRISRDVYFKNARAEASLCENSPGFSLDSLLGYWDKALGLTDTLVPVHYPTHGNVAVSFYTGATGDTVYPVGVRYVPDPGYSGPDSLRLAVTNGVMADTVSISLNVINRLRDAGYIDGQQELCAGSNVLLTDTTGNGAWSVLNTHAQVDAGNLTGLTAGVDTVLYTIGNLCGNAVASLAVTIDPLPYVGAINGPGTLCLGESAAYSDLVPAGIWSLSNGMAALTIFRDSCEVTALASGTDTLTYEVSDGRCAASTATVLNLKQLADPQILNGLPQLCTGAQMTVTGAPGGGVWAIRNDHASLIAKGSQAQISAEGEGADTVVYIYTNVCGPAEALFPFESDTLPAKPVVGRDLGNLFARTGYSSYQWVLNGTDVPGAVADTFAPQSSGNYVVRVTGGTGCENQSDPIYFEGCGSGDIHIYPNPTTGDVHIDWCALVDLQLWTLDGKKIGYWQQVSTAVLPDLANGIYMLIIFNENGKRLRTERLVVRTE